MGLLDRLLGRSSPPDIYSPRVTRTGSWQEWWESISVNLSEESPAQLFASQPHLRTVVTFRARNIAQLGLHVFERDGETDRRRDRTSALAMALSGVDGPMTTYELIFALIGDLDLYDRAHWLVMPADTPVGWMIRRLPPSWVTPHESGVFEVHSWRVSYGDKAVVVPSSQVLSFTGYSPVDPRRGSPAVESLRGTLQEQIEASLYRKQVWKNAGRVSAVLQRPATAPQWSGEARETFREDWYAKFTGRGPRAGGTPILEDGMTLQRIDFTAQEQQFVEAAKLSLTTVAAAFHVNPTMIGQNDGANYSNVREFRKMLYGDTLGPLIAQIEARINTFLVPMLGGDPATQYVEFNIAEKLQGNFEEQTAALQSAVGGPWMLRSEARARMNLPAIEGADELVVPMNVISGGQASPRDSGSQNRNTAPAMRAKSAPDDDEVERLQDVLAAFFKRQRRVVMSALGGEKSPQWWDAARWNRELGDDLHEFFISLSASAARAAIEAAGGNTAAFDVGKLVKYLRAKADGVAEDINATTLEQLESALDDDDADPQDVFTLAAGVRSAAAALTLATAVAGFATIEAAKQTGGARKTWLVASGNPRPSHAAMNGETVALDDTFSNGMRWPGDSSDADEVAGCSCFIEYSFD